MQHQAIMNGLNAIIQRSSYSKGFQPLLAYLKLISSQNTPSHLIDLMKLGELTGRCYRFVQSGDIDTYDDLIDQVAESLRQLGYRPVNGIFSSQEHALVGSSSVDPQNPYKPWTLLSGELTLEEVRKARELSRIMSVLPLYYRIPKAKGGNFPINVTLEQLDENGNTIRDPQPVDESLNPITHEKSENFPFRRD